MCGRFQLELTMEDIINLLDVIGEVKERYQEDHLSSFVQEKKDFHPGSLSLTVDKDGLHKNLWGFPLGKKLVFNARQETIFEKPFFRQAALTERCLVPATLFYEWQGKEKIKHLIRTEDPLFFMGAVKEKFPDSSGSITEHFSIITTASEGGMKKIHERTPFILDKKDIQRFLDPKASPNEIKEILNQKNLNLLIERASKEEQLSFF